MQWNYSQYVQKIFKILPPFLLVSLKIILGRNFRQYDFLFQRRTVTWSKFCLCFSLNLIQSFFQSYILISMPKLQKIIKAYEKCMPQFVNLAPKIVKFPTLHGYTKSKKYRRKLPLKCEHTWWCTILAWSLKYNSKLFLSWPF